MPQVDRRMTSIGVFISGVLVWSMPVVACGSSSETESELPALIDSSELADSERPVPLPELEGLTEGQARQWAEDSGFELVVRSDEDYPDVLIPSRRLIIEVDRSQIVTGATAG
jgi:hypothetical protein